MIERIEVLLMEAEAAISIYKDPKAFLNTLEISITAARKVGLRLSEASEFEKRRRDIFLQWENRWAKALKENI